VIEASKTGGQLWEPKNYDGKYEGPMRCAPRSPSPRTWCRSGSCRHRPELRQDYIQRFGFDPKMHPAYLTMALGAGSTTPLQMAGGLRRLRERRLPREALVHLAIEDNRGRCSYAAKPEVAGTDAERVSRRAQCFHHDDAHARCRALRNGRARDVARAQRPRGQDGTTNDHVDAWFAGFQASAVAVAWIGFDTPANWDQ
jgi:penicillin-binding protein 1A